ncbi:MAG: hypothetical protein R3223_01500 [Longimicrobiales bacterium]|nr:hypothetical protein [Longimicrobiales bacterium]
MKEWARYGLASLLILAIVSAGLWPFLDERSRSGLTLAAATAFSTQLVAFGLLRWARRHSERFLMAWAAGILARFGVLGVTALVASRFSGIGTPALVLGLAGFLFVLALMEPLFLTPNVVPDDGD